uniref:FAS1 domain-containing protein n=1 Tax=Glossina palpalis gambiensis TaxID=67801 RepID=A0A1B0BW99_9MUSC
MECNAAIVLPTLLVSSTVRVVITASMTLGHNADALASIALEADNDGYVVAAFPTAVLVTITPSATAYFLGENNLQVVNMTKFMNYFINITTTDTSLKINSANTLTVLADFNLPIVSGNFNVERDYFDPRFSYSYYDEVFEPIFKLCLCQLNQIMNSFNKLLGLAFLIQTMYPLFVSFHISFGKMYSTQRI